jgi:hypothetical protein
MPLKTPVGEIRTPILDVGNAFSTHFSMISLSRVNRPSKSPPYLSSLLFVDD